MALKSKLCNYCEVKKTTLWQDISLCTAISLACAFYEFERFMPSFALDIIKPLLVVLFLACWFWCSFSNGVHKRYGFLIFTVLYWILPRLAIIRHNNAGILNYNKYMDALSQYAALFADLPVFGLANFFNAGSFQTVVVLILWCACLYLAGGYISAAQPRKGESL